MATHPYVCIHMRHIMCVRVYTYCMRRNFYLTKTEDEWLSLKPHGFVRKLIQSAMEGELMPVYTPEEGNYVVGADKSVDGGFVALKDIARSRAKGNPNACKHCGRIKVAGKCLTCKK